MAKVNIEYDTVTKSLNVMMDGQTVEKIDSVTFYKYYNYDEDGVDSYYLDMSTFEKDKENKTNKKVTIYASENEEQKFKKIVAGLFGE